MELEIQQYERCETTSCGSIEDHLIGITKPSIDRMLKTDNPADCIALYTFYCYVRKWQNNSAPKATSEFAMNAMKWGRERFSKAKSKLIELGLIEDIQRFDDKNRVVGWYIGVKFAQAATLATFDKVKIPDSHHTGFPQGGPTRLWESRTQIPITNNKIPITNKEMQSDKMNDGGLLPSQSEVNNPAKRNPKSRDTRTTEEFVEYLKQTYDWVDVDTELKRIDAWLARPVNKDRKKTRKFVENWIARSEKPMEKQSYVPGTMLGINQPYTPCL